MPEDGGGGITEDINILYTTAEKKLETLLFSVCFYTQLLAEFPP